ncbi:MAG: hypothetical protein ACJA0B_000847 [Alcanivorax borkumensis]|jgi:hypothetical protein
MPFLELIVEVKTGLQAMRRLEQANSIVEKNSYL